MDVIERIDCDSSAESNVSEVSVSNDDDLEPSRESDVATSTITTQRLMEFPCLV